MRAIEPIPVLQPVSLSFGPVPELRWLEIAVLRVDETYQRPIQSVGLATIRAIATGFDWRKFGPVVVSPIEDGLFAIVDGQHRTTAACVCDIDKVPCLVIQADRKRQAEAFLAINGRVTKISSLALYKSRLASGEPAAVEMRAAAAAADVEILTYPVAANHIGPRQTLACGTIERMMSLYGRAVVELALRAIVAAAHDVPGHVTAIAIQAFCEVIIDHPEWSKLPTFVEVCRGFDLETQIAAAREGARAKRMPVLPHAEAAIVTFLFARLGEKAAA